MKYLLTIILSLFIICSFGQVVDTVKLPLSSWQDRQISSLSDEMKKAQDAVKTISDKQLLLINAILDQNKIDATAISGLDYKPGKLILIIKKPK